MRGLCILATARPAPASLRLVVIRLRQSLNSPYHPKSSKFVHHQTLIVQPSSPDKLEALKAFLTALKIDFLPAERPAAAVTDPDTIQLIEDFEQGRIKAVPYDLNDLKAIADAQP